MIGKVTRKEMSGNISNFNVLKKLGKYNNIINLISYSQLGEGSFSEVFRVIRKSDNAEYAMKKVKMGKLSAKEKENALNEIRILASINHPNVIGFKEGFFEEGTGCLCIVMEHADAGDML